MSSHSEAVRLAEQTNSALGRLFDRMGGGDHPRSGIVLAYSKARRSLARNLGDPNATRAILDQLRREVSSVAAQLLGQASGLGYRMARDNAALYDLSIPIMTETGMSATFLAQWLSPLDQQIGAIEAMVRAGLVDPAVILGDDVRLGLLSPGPVTRDGAKWLTATVSAITANAWKPSAAAQPVYKRQAIATLDQFTTDCCLRVHTQVVAFDQPFHLVGTPRFADYLMETPFHWNCRSVTALVHEADAADKLTRDMRDAANAELEAREKTGKRQEIWPSHARSRRS